MALTLASLALFLFFVHHLVRSLQAENVVEKVADRLFSRIDLVFPETDEESDDNDEEGDDLSPWAEVENEKSARADTSGYLQFIDTSTLVELATRHECRIQSSVRPGEFVLEN